MDYQFWLMTLLPATICLSEILIDTTMIYLHKSLADWGNDSFPTTFKQEVEALSSHQLPLQQGLTQSSHVSDAGFQLAIYKIDETPTTIRVKAAVFYSGVIAGCNCADDPSPIGEQNEFCVIHIEVDKNSAATTFSFLAE